MKKALRETQTLRTGCSKAEPKIFAPPQTPFLGERDGQNLISWRWSLPLPTNPFWWRLMYTISSYCGNRPTVSLSLHFNNHFLDGPGLAGTRMSPFCILFELRVMEVVVTMGAIRQAMLQYIQYKVTVLRQVRILLCGRCRCLMRNVNLPKHKLRLKK